MRIWLGIVGFGMSTFIVVSILFATWILRALNDIRVNMSSKTRIMHKKLSIGLILQVRFPPPVLSTQRIQTSFYNLFFVGISATILVCAFTGSGGTGNPTEKFYRPSSSIQHNLLGIFLLIHIRMCTIGSNK